MRPTGRQSEKARGLGKSDARAGRRTQRRRTDSPTDRRARARGGDDHRAAETTGRASERASDAGLLPAVRGAGAAGGSDTRGGLTDALCGAADAASRPRATPAPSAARRRCVRACFGCECGRGWARLTGGGRSSTGCRSDHQQVEGAGGGREQPERLGGAQRLHDRGTHPVDGVSAECRRRVARSLAACFRSRRLTRACAAQSVAGGSRAPAQGKGDGAVQLHPAGATAAHTRTARRVAATHARNTAVLPLARDRIARRNSS